MKVECYTQGLGDRFTRSYYQGKIKLTVAGPAGIKITPARWEMEMLPNNNQNLATAEILIEVSSQAPLGNHTIEFRGEKEDGGTVMAELVVAVTAAEE